MRVIDSCLDGSVDESETAQQVHKNKSFNNCLIYLLMKLDIDESEDNCRDSAVDD